MRTILYDPPEIEYLDGQPYPKVSPKTTHSWVQSALLMIIDTCGRGLGFTGTEWRFRPGEVDGTPTTFVPDVAFVYKERLRGLSGRDFDEPPFSPDIAVEVRSPHDNLRYLSEKIERYLATGSLLVLDVDPKTRSIVAHTAEAVRECSQRERFSHRRAPWLTFECSAVFANRDRR